VRFPIALVSPSGVFARSGRIGYTAGSARRKTTFMLSGSVVSSSTPVTITSATKVELTTLKTQAGCPAVTGALTKPGSFGGPFIGLKYVGNV
jgi:hypothetical protein